MQSLSASDLPPPGAPGAVVTLQGTIAEGVEAGCVVLVDETGAVLANLFGLDPAIGTNGVEIEVTGTFTPDLMTTCQQGTPFEVTEARAL